MIFSNIEDIQKQSQQLLEVLAPEIEHWNDQTSKVARSFLSVVSRTIDKHKHCAGIFAFVL